jgi:hypothetical protein
MCGYFLLPDESHPMIVAKSREVGFSETGFLFHTGWAPFIGRNPSQTVEILVADSYLDLPVERQR